MDNICAYGCNQKGVYQLKNGKWSCSTKWQQCKAFRKRIRYLNKGNKNPNYGLKRSEETKRKQSKALKGRTYIDLHGEEKALLLKKRIREIKRGKKQSNKTKQKRSDALKGRSYIDLYGERKAKKIKKLRQQIFNGINHPMFLTISKIKSKYPFFSKVEEMRYNPDKPEGKELQVHCKNHECENSKEKGGWFTPKRSHFYDRKRSLENHGIDNAYFYCSEECKHECPLYMSKGGDPFQKILRSYTSSEYSQFKQYVLTRDNHECQYCGEKATIVHHERPQKLEPFFALDPDYAWSVCSKCHYEKGHKTGTECSTGGLAAKICQ